MGLIKPSDYGSGFMNPGAHALQSYGFDCIFESDFGLTIDTSLGRNSVSNWANQGTAGSDYDLSQGTKANQPTWTDPDIEFTTSTYVLSFSGNGLQIARNVAGFTILAVVKSAHGATSYKTAFKATANGSTTSSRIFYCLENSSNKNYVQLRPDDSTSNTKQSDSTHTNNVYTLIGMRIDFSGGNVYLYQDGAADGSKAISPTQNTPDTDSDIAAVGATGVATNYLNGSMKGLYISKTLLSTGDLDTVEGIINTKWSIY